MDISLGSIASASDIQKDYRRIFNRAKRTKQPVVIMRGNKPDVAVVDMRTLEELNKKIEEAEIIDTLQAIAQGEEELKAGKSKITKSLSSLL